MGFGFTLPFGLIDCVGCGARRIRGVVCPDCGSAPARWEVDVRLQRRQAVAEQLIADTRMSQCETGASTAPDLMGPLDVPAEAERWLPRFLRALQEAAESEFQQTETLSASVQELSGMSSAMRQMEPKRPFGRAHQLAQYIVAGLVSVFNEYRESIMAATPVAAQEHAAVAQQTIDGLAVRAEELAEWMNRQRAFEAASSFAESLALVIAFGAEDARVDTLLELQQHHHAQLANLLRVEVDPSVALMYAVQHTVIDQFFHPDEYISKVKLAVQTLAQGGETLDRLCSDGQFRADLKRLELDIFDSALQCQAAIASARLPRQAAKAVVSLHKSLVEAAGRTAAAPLLTAVGAKSQAYSKLRQADATQLIRLSQDRPTLARLLGGLDPHLRIADSHSGIIYGDDSLQTDLATGSAVYRYDDLIDSTFEAVESCMAVSLAVHLAMCARGVADEGEGGLAILGLTDQEIVDLCLRSFPTRVSAAHIEAGHLLVDIRDDRPEGISATLAAMLASIRPEAVAVIEVRLPSGDSWWIDASMYRNRLNVEDEFLKQVSFVRIQAEWRSAEGARWLGEDVFKKWTAIQAAEALDMELRHSMTRLRALRRLADTLGATEVADSLTSLMSWVRRQAIGLSMSRNETAALEAIRAWAGLDVDVALI